MKGKRARKLVPHLEPEWLEPKWLRKWYPGYAWFRPGTHSGETPPPSATKTSEEKRKEETRRNEKRRHEKRDREADSEAEKETD